MRKRGGREAWKSFIRTSESPVGSPRTTPEPESPILSPRLLNTSASHRSSPSFGIRGDDIHLDDLLSPRSHEPLELPKVEDSKIDRTFSMRPKLSEEEDFSPDLIHRESSTAVEPSSLHSYVPQTRFRFLISEEDERDERDEENF